MDPDPAIFFIDLQDANKKPIFSEFFCLLFFESTLCLHHFSNIKCHKEVKVGIKVFCTAFA
jgi:hypothetical protein